MKIVKFKNAQELGAYAAKEIANAINEKPDIVLGLATGSTPIPTYNSLVDLYNEKKVDFSKVRSVNLDEYVGLEPTHDQSYRYFMNEHLFDKVNINKANTHVPNGVASDIAKECVDYEKLIDSIGGVDLQILGIGTNGHIGFNEPSDSFTKCTSVAELAPSTIESNKRFFDSADEVPKQAVSMGIKTIMKSKKIFLIATGSEKADAINKTVNGDITPQIPASVLQLHPDVTVLVDESAGKSL